MSGSGISWATCKSAPRCRTITMPAPYYSSFLQAGCPSCRLTNSVKALKAEVVAVIRYEIRYWMQKREALGEKEGFNELLNKHSVNNFFPDKLCDLIEARDYGLAVASAGPYAKLQIMCTLLRIDYHATVCCLIMHTTSSV